MKLEVTNKSISSKDRSAALGLGGCGSVRLPFRRQLATEKCGALHVLRARSDSRPIILSWWLLLAAVVSTHAQTYSIDWHTIDGGGGTSTGGGYSVSGTIAQPDAGKTMTGGTLSVVGGFWSIFAVQNPNGPLLTMKFTSRETAVVRWPSWAAGFLLQQSEDLKSGSWTAVNETVIDDGTTKFIVVTSSSPRRFYRLFKP